MWNDAAGPRVAVVVPTLYRRRPYWPLARHVFESQREHYPNACLFMMSDSGADELADSLTGVNCRVTHMAEPKTLGEKINLLHRWVEPYKPDWFALMSDDDWWHPRCLADRMAYALGHQAARVGHTTYWFCDLNRERKLCKLDITSRTNQQTTSLSHMHTLCVWQEIRAARGGYPQVPQGEDNLFQQALTQLHKVPVARMPCPNPDAIWIRHDSNNMWPVDLATIKSIEWDPRSLGDVIGHDLADRYAEASRACLKLKNEDSASSRHPA